MTETRFSIEIADDVKQVIPERQALRHWMQVAMEGTVGCVALRIVQQEEMIMLNGQFRDKPVPTNVLSFPVSEGLDTAMFDGINTEGLAALEITDPDQPDADSGLPDAFIGDIAICADIVAMEAAQQNKQAEAHWAHLVIHGVLHLRGFDHVQEADATSMEQKESVLVTSLGFSDPWYSAGQIDDANLDLRSDVDSGLNADSNAISNSDPHSGVNQDSTSNQNLGQNTVTHIKQRHDTGCHAGKLS